ncbi:MAG: hypothetical protein AVDCRST_MAG56-4079, partial [uncultured Cytophagales bacterium]
AQSPQKRPGHQQHPGGGHHRVGLRRTDAGGVRVGRQQFHHQGHELRQILAYHCGGGALLAAGQRPAQLPQTQNAV